MNNNYFNKLQLCSMLIVLIVVPFIGGGAFSLFKSAGVDAYFSVIIGGIIGILNLLLFMYIFNYKRDISIRDKIIILFGKKFGFVINLIICILFFTICLFSMYNLINFIVSQFLAETPMLIIGILFSLVIIYINIKGIEVMSRVIFIILTINISLFFIAVLGLIPHFDFYNLKPVLEFGMKRPLIGSLYLLTMNTAPIYLLLIIPKNNIIQNEKVNKWLFVSYIISIIIILIALILTLGTLGIHLASIYQYPEYIIFKRINLFSILDRIENIIIIQWIFGLYTMVSVTVYYISNTIKFNNNSKLLPSVITLIILFTSLYIFSNNTRFNVYAYKYLPILRGSILILFLIIGIRICLKKKINKIKSL